MPIIVVTLLLRTIWTFRKFGIVYLFAFGDPLFATTTLPVLIRYLAFDARKLEPAAVTATIMLVRMMVLSWGYYGWYDRAENNLE